MRAMVSALFPLIPGRVRAPLASARRAMEVVAVGAVLAGAAVGSAGMAATQARDAPAVRVGAVKVTPSAPDRQARVMTDVFQGRKGVRSYDLRFSPVLDGSEQVRVAGRRLKLGVEYTIDYNTATLHLRKPVDATVEVSYETGHLPPAPPRRATISEFPTLALREGVAAGADARVVAGRKRVGVTLYNQGFGLVKDQRSVRLDKGVQWLRFEDVAATIDPTTVEFRSLTAPESVTVREQNYQYDLITPSSILQKSVGGPVRVRQFLADGKERVLEGTLLSPGTLSVPAGRSVLEATGMVVKAREGVVLSPQGQVEVPELPAGLITRPALLWKLESRKEGEHTGEISYLAGGLSWSSDYVARVNADDSRVDITGWVTLSNSSGVDYPEAEVKLVAGDVRREGATQAGPGRSSGYAGPGPSRAGTGEESFGEYRLYSLPEATTIEDKSTKQISYLTAAQVPVEKLFIFDPARMQWWRIFTGGGRMYDYYSSMQPGQGRGTMANQKVSVLFEIANTVKNNLGLALPRGKAKAYKADSRGALQFVGEDWLDHTPPNEKFRLYVGDAFDLVGTRRWTDYQVRPAGFEGAAEISLRNHKKEPVTIRVVEHLMGDWTVLQKSHDYEKKDAWTIEFPVPVPPDQEVKATYRVRVVF